MRHGSLFSGIGGFDLAAEWMGWENVFHCEWNDFGKRVLKYYWPKAISYDDITKTDFTIHNGQIDILTGGFPCQPYSQAGKRLGKEDDRHLWPEMLRAVREIQPRWIVGENVYGLVNWSGGLVFEEVQADLENEGYEVQAFILPACAKNAPHRRDRIWFVAYSNSNRYTSCREGKKSKGNGSKNNGEQKSRGEQTKWINGLHGLSWDATNSNGLRSRESGQERQAGEFNKNGEKETITTHTKSTGREACTKRQRQEQFRRRNEPMGSGQWKKFPTQSPVCDGNDGLSSRLDAITFPKWRSESIKAGGNAIVPQVALEIFKTIENYGKNT